MLTENQIKRQLIELKVREELLLYGFDISAPIYKNALYDIVVDIGQEILKIKIEKSIGNEDGSFTFSCQNKTTGGVVKNYTNEEIDYFATVWNDKVYLVHVDETYQQKTLKFTGEADDCSRYLAENILKPFSRMKVTSVYSNVAKEKNHCLHCGCEMNRDNTYCISCSNLLRKMDIPKREELKTDIRKMSFIDVAHKYEVTDNMVRKWFKLMNIPTKRLKISSYTEEEWALV